MSQFARQFFPLGALRNGENVALIFSKQTRERLAGTCFRGRMVRCAGNFFAWTSFEEFFRAVSRGLLEFVRETIEELRPILSAGKKRSFTESVEITGDRLVGWTSTDSIDRYRDDELETFYPNLRSRARRVRREFALAHPAPLTRSVTVIAEIRRDRYRPLAWCVIVHSIYPGRDIGDLEDDITEREGVIFFDFEHPGAAA